MNETFQFERQTPRIAVFWDFSNLHTALVACQRPPKLKPVDIRLVLDYARGLGSIAINRAYGDWRQFTGYDADLMRNCVDAIQLFPFGKTSKTGAAVRMCADILDVAAYNPNIDVFLLVGGDSTFFFIGQKLRERGKRVYGIGTFEASSRTWISVCDEFKYYENLERTAKGPASDTAPGVEESAEVDPSVKRLLLSAIRTINESVGNPIDAPVEMARLKPAVQQLAPDFDEATYGCLSFKEFLEKACTDVVDLKDGEGFSVKGKPGKPGPVWAYPLFDAFLRIGRGLKQESDSASDYARVLKKTQFRVVSPGLFEPLCQAAFRAAADGPFVDWDDFVSRVGGAVPHAIQITAQDARLFQAMCYRSRIFDLDAINRRISIPAHSPVEIEQAIIFEILHRIESGSGIEIDEKVLSKLVFGDESATHVAVVAATNAAFKAGAVKLS